MNTRKKYIPLQLRNEYAFNELLGNESEEPNFHPQLKKFHDKLRTLKCCKKVGKLRFQKNGVILFTCMECRKQKMCCGLCIQLFKQPKKSNLKRHCFSIHFKHLKDSDEFDCSFCSESFENLDDLLDHVSLEYKKLENDGKKKLFFSKIDGDENNDGDEEMGEKNQTEDNIDEFDEGGEFNEEVDEIDVQRILNFENIDDDDIEEENIVSTSSFPHYLFENDLNEENNEENNEEIRVETEKNENDILDYNEFIHFQEILSELEHFSIPNDGDIVIEPIEKFTNFSFFQNYHNLHLIRFAKKASLSVENLSQLIKDLKEVYKSPLEFFPARKLNKCLTKIEGMKWKTFVCPRGHKVLILPIEESLKYLFGQDSFLYCFHVAPKEIDDDDGLNAYYKTEEFKKIADEVNEKGQHPICIIGFRDKFPGYVTTYFPLKGFYFFVLNASFPECLAHVCLFSQGGNCEKCLEVVEEKWIENCNRLSDKFLVKHKLLNKYINCALRYPIESEDTPERHANLLTKRCVKCNIDHSENYDEAYGYDGFDSKTLLKSEKLYEKVSEFDLNVLGNKTRVTEIENEKGYTFLEYQFNDTTKKNEKKLKKPSSFYKMNEILKTKITFDPEPFHSVIRCYIENTINSVGDECCEFEKRSIDRNLRLIEFPSGVKKPKSFWNLGKNFDVHICALYVFPECCVGVLGNENCRQLKINFGSITKILSPDASKTDVHLANIDFRESFDYLKDIYYLSFPTSHDTFHIFDITPDRGLWFLWWARIFEIFHLFFKKKMYHCFLLNPAKYLVEQFCFEKNLDLLPFKKEKYFIFNETVKYVLYEKTKNFGRNEKMFREKYNIPEIKTVTMDEIKILKIFTKFYTKKEILVDSNDYEIRIRNIYLITMLVTEVFKQHYIYLFCDVIDDTEDENEIVIFEMDKIKGKAFKMRGRVFNYIK